ncbi:MAG: ABC transporter permease, partial [Pseudomonadota bacterium]
MGAYILRRLLAAIPTLVVASILVFAFIHLIPGDPAAVMLGDMADTEEIEALREKMGLNRPLWEQYLIWVSGVVQGDLGTS